MKNPNILIALSIILVLILGVKYSYYEDKAQEEHPSVNEIATVPDNMMRNATHYYRDYGQRLTSIKYIKKAIESMQLVEKDMDSTSNAHIETAIADLEKLVDEFEKKDIDENHMQHAFATALNSLAFAQLRVSEKYMEEGLEDDASAATKYALKHLNSAMYFSEAAELQAEEHIFDMISELKELDDISDEELREKIHLAVLELNEVLDKAELSAEKTEQD
jgi:hypothetical protein